MTEATNCTWPGTDPLYVTYHDTEWGVPCHTDHLLLEAIILDGAQAGLSWLTILRKRENYRRAFDNFDPATVAAYGEDRAAALLADPGIVRNRMKIRSAINNARRFREIQVEFGSFDAYVWAFVGGQPIVNAWERLDQIPAETDESRALSADLRRRGFTFVGPTIIYAFMQAIGMVNDHIVTCSRYRKVRSERR